MFRLISTMLLVWGILFATTLAVVNLRHNQPPFQDWLLLLSCPEYEECDLYRLQPDLKFTQKITHVSTQYRSEVLGILDVPDGNWIYFVDTVDEQPGLYRVREDGSHRQYLRQGNYQLRSVSPNQDWYILSSSDNGYDLLYALSTSDATLTPIWTSTKASQQIEELAWLPQQQLLIIKLKDFSFYTLKIGIWQPTRFLEMFNALKFLGASADGRYVTVWGENNGQVGILTIDIIQNKSDFLFRLPDVERVFIHPQSTKYDY